MEQGFKDNYFRDEGPYTICCTCSPGISVTPFEPPNAQVTTILKWWTTNDHHTQKPVLRI